MYDGRTLFHGIMTHSVSHNARVPLADGYVDLGARVVVRDGVREDLSAREAALLRYLAERSERAVPRDELLARVWGYAPGTKTRTVDTTVYRLRGRIEVDPTAPRHLLTEHGEGYRWHPAPAANEEAGSAVVGRVSERRALEDAVARGPGVTTVLGPGGVGKTRLTCWVADASGWRVIPLVDVATRSDMLRTIAEGYGLEAWTTPKALAEGVARLASSRGGVVVLDNVEQIAAYAAEVAEEIAARGVAVVCTSRTPLGVDGEVRIELGPLDGDDGVRLLARRAGALDDDVAAAQLVEVLDGLPLAIEIAAPRVAFAGCRAVLDMLDADTDAALLDAQAGADAPPHHRSLDAALASSWMALSPGARRLLHALALGRGPTPIAIATLAAGLGASEGLDAAMQLRAHSFVSIDSARRLDALDIVRRFARRRGATDGDAIRRHATVWLEHVRRPRGRDDDAWRRHREAVGDALGTLMAIADRPEMIGRELAGRAAIVAAEHLIRVGPIALASDVLDRVDLSGTSETEVRCAELRVDAAVLRGAAADADAAAAVLSRTTTGARRELGMARAAMAGRRFDEAAEGLERALGCDESVDADVLATAWAYLGSARYARGRFDDAVAAYRRALASATVASAPYAAVTAGVRLGTALMEQGELDEARVHLSEALARSEALGERRQAAVVRSNLGVLLHERGEVDRARRVLTKACDALAAIGHVRFEGFAHAALGLVALEQGDAVEAAQLLERARRLLVDAGDAVYVAVVDVRLGMVGVAQGDPEEANARWCAAEAAFEQLGTTWGSEGLAALRAADVAAPDTAFARLHLRVMAALSPP